METLTVCPSTLAEGFDTYSPTARKLLFDGKVVSHILPFDSPNNENSDTEEYARHVGRISLSVTITPACVSSFTNFSLSHAAPSLMVVGRASKKNLRISSVLSKP